MEYYNKLKKNNVKFVESMIYHKSTYRIFALTLAFLMFFTSAGLTIDMHYCGGTLKSFNFFGKAKTCQDLSGEVEATMNNCSHNKKMLSEKKTCSEDRDCCTNKTVQIQSDNEKRIQVVDFVLSKQLKQFVISYAKVFLANNLDSKRDSADFADYKPPLIQKNIPVINQSFLL